MIKIAVLDGYTLNPGDNPWDALSALGELTVYERTATDQIVDRAKEADVVLTNKTPLSGETLRALPRLKFVSVLATGYNVVDLEAASELGIAVSNVPAYSAASVAQHSIALLLELCQHVGDHDRSVKAGDWSCCRDFCYWTTAPVELDGLTLGLVGYGEIGKRVAEIARALGMRVIYARRPTSPVTDAASGQVSLDTLARQADVISLHCALSKENAGFVNRAFISKLKPGVLLINTARGGLINECDLAQALREGKLGGAAVDVLSEEPPSQNHPLLHAPRCLITPHIAWTSLAARRRLMETTAANVAAFLAKAPVNVVNR